MIVPDRLLDAVVLQDHHCAVGLTFINGVGFRIGTFDGHDLRAMSTAAARRMAKELAASEEAETLAPVIEALRAKADALDALAEPVGSA